MSSIAVGMADRWPTDDAGALAGRAARGGAPREEPRPAEDLPRRRARRRQDLRDAAAAQRASARTASTSSSASSRRMAAPRPQALLARPRGRSRAAAIDYRGPTSRGDGPRRASSRAGPQLALVDELAHTNAPGSRHPKRYHDVEELLAAGIDVYTTAQHPAPREPQRRRRADHPHPRARDGAGLDPRPRRRHRGHRPHARRADPAAARRARSTSREHGRARARALLLARQPDRAARAGAARAPPSASTTSSVTHMQAHAIAGPWPAGERVLVCVSEDPRAAGLVRYAKRLADRLHAPWTALTSRRARSQRLRERRARPHRRRAAARRAARRRGRDPAGRRARIAEDVLAYARANNVTQIVIGKSTRSRWFEMLHGSVVHDLVRRAGAHQRPRHRRRGGRRRADPVQGRADAPTQPPARRCVPTPSRSLAVAAALGLVKLIEPLVGVETARPRSS